MYNKNKAGVQNEKVRNSRMPFGYNFCFFFMPGSRAFRFAGFSFASS
jgi:hypothetical protein